MCDGSTPLHIHVEDSLRVPSPTSPGCAPSLGPRRPEGGGCAALGSRGRRGAGLPGLGSPGTISPPPPSWLLCPLLPLFSPSGASVVQTTGLLDKHSNFPACLLFSSVFHSSRVSFASPAHPSDETLNIYISHPCFYFHVISWLFELCSPPATSKSILFVVLRLSAAVLLRC